MAVVQATQTSQDKHLWIAFDEVEALPEQAVDRAVRGAWQLEDETRQKTARDEDQCELAVVSPSSGRVLALDGVRALACVGIFLLHSFTANTFSLSARTVAIADAWPVTAVMMQTAPGLVDLFFAMTGFLAMTRFLTSKQRKSFKKVFGGRARRIWPALIFGFVLHCVVMRPRIVRNRLAGNGLEAFMHDEFGIDAIDSNESRPIAWMDLAALLPTMLFVNNAIPMAGPLTQTWSTAVQMQFLVVFHWLCGLGRVNLVRNTKRVLLACLVVRVLVAVLTPYELSDVAFGNRIGIFLQEDYARLTKRFLISYANPVQRMISLLGGVLIADLRHRGKLERTVGRWLPVGLVLGVVSVVCAVLRWPHSHHVHEALLVFGAPGHVLFWISLFAWSLSSRNSTWLALCRSSLVQLISRHSHVIYFVQITCMMWLRFNVLPALPHAFTPGDVLQRIAIDAFAVFVTTSAFPFAVFLATTAFHVLVTKPMQWFGSSKKKQE